MGNVKPLLRSGTNGTTVRTGGDGGDTAAERHVSGSFLRMTVLRSSAEGHLVNALALRGDEGRSTLR